MQRCYIIICNIFKKMKEVSTLDHDSLPVYSVLLPVHSSQACDMENEELKVKLP